MNEKKVLTTTVVVGILAAAGIGGLIYRQKGVIEQTEQEIVTLETNIASARQLIEGTPALERDVIILRELAQVIKGILPDEQDVNNLVRTFNTFEEEAQVEIRQLRKKPNFNAGTQAQADFDLVAYTLTLQADAFELLDFLDHLETYERFMRVPSLKLTSASRSELEKQGKATHRVQLDVETFVYEPKADAAPVTIEGYERKRDLLLGEINRRKQALTVSNYAYRGDRGRRDPWVDPRAPVNGDGESALSVQEQMAIVEDLSERTQAVLQIWEDVKAADNVIEEIKLRADLEDSLTALEIDVRRVEAEAGIRFVPSQRRMQLEVLGALAELRSELMSDENGLGPSSEMLREVLDGMIVHLEQGEYQLMLDAFGTVENRLEYAAADPLREPLVRGLEELAFQARTVLDFEKIELRVQGTAILEGQPSVVLINGRSLAEGEMLGSDIYVRSIEQDSVEFIYRGVVLSRRF